MQQPRPSSGHSPTAAVAAAGAEAAAVPLSMSTPSLAASHFEGADLPTDHTADVHLIDREHAPAIDLRAAKQPPSPRLPPTKASKRPKTKDGNQPDRPPLRLMAATAAAYLADDPQPGQVEARRAPEYVPNTSVTHDQCAEWSFEAQTEIMRVEDSSAGPEAMAAALLDMRMRLERRMRSFSTWNECSSALIELTPDEAETLVKMVCGGGLLSVPMATTRNMLHTRPDAMAALASSLMRHAMLPPRQSDASGVVPNQKENDGHCEIVLAVRRQSAVCGPCDPAVWLNLTSRKACPLCASQEKGLPSLLQPGETIYSLDSLGASQRSDARSRRPSPARLSLITAGGYQWTKYAAWCADE